MLAAIILGLYLLLMSIIDIKQRSISRLSILLGLAICVGLFTHAQELTWVDLCGGVIFGIFFLGLSKITRERIGYGDSLLILLLGIGLGYRQQMIVVFMAFFISALFSFIMIWRKKLKKHSAIPFIPFIGVAYLISLI